MDAATLALLANAAATLFMTGLIWFVQVVHYPLFARVGADGYGRYQAEHMDRTTRVVGLPMLVELAAAAALVWMRPAEVPAAWAWIGLALAVLVWLSTGLVLAPTHGRLASGWDAALGKRLVDANWFRTACWTARSLLALAMLARVIG